MSETPTHDSVMNEWDTVRKSAEARTKITLYAEFVDTLKKVSKPSVAIRNLINQYEQRLDEAVKNG